ncbi:MAG: tetratricopeptide repeat protein [Bacteroidales bacterium]|nr:tetratricopeptide repeat protein [Bacteroidales bacterium]
MQVADRKRFKISFIFAFLFCISIAYAQKNQAYTSPDREFNSAKELFKLEQYGAAKEKFTCVYDAILEKYAYQKEQSLYYMGVCAALLYHADAEKIILHFIEEYPENSQIDKLYFYLGNYYFSENAYRKALRTYEKIEERLLTPENMAEYEFKKAYSYFITEKYNEAKPLFVRTKEKESQYQSKALFYYSHILYLEKSYHSALTGFEKLKNVEGYNHIIPFYMAHIYFALGEYDNIIEQAPDLLAKSSQKRLGEMNRIIAQSHFQLKQYPEAIPYFESYLDKTQIFTCEDFYEVGICYYKVKQYDKAINYLTQSFCKDNDSVNQYVYYALGDCYLKTNQKEYASNAFLYAYELKHNPIISEDGLYAYAKLQYELSFNPFVPTITAFEKFLNEYPNSTYKNEAEQYLSNIYLTTKNYKAAIQSLEKIQTKSIVLLKAYQRALYFRAIELFNDEQLTTADSLLNKAITNNYIPEIYAKSLFWKGEIAYQQGKYEESINNYNLFISTQIAPQVEEYPMAFYNLGYAQYSSNLYSLALQSFLLFEKQNLENIDQKTKIDATNRIGDCYYVTASLQNAITYYDKVIENKNYEVDYALYQKAQSQAGLRLYDSKIATLETLMKDYPNSIYTLDAQIEIANTYQLVGNNTKAEELYLDFIKKNPRSPYLKNCMLKLGGIYFNTDQNDKALDIYKQIVKKHPNSEEASIALKNIESIYSSSGNIEEFFVYVKNVSFANITVEHQDTIMYNAAAEKYFNKQFNEASKGFNDYIQRFPKGVYATHAHFYLAEIAYRKSDDDIALTNFEYVIQNPLDQFELIAIQNVADLYYKKKNYSQSLTNYDLLNKKAITPTQKNDALLGLTRSSYYSKDYSNTIAYGDVLLKENKSNVDAHNEVRSMIASSLMELNDLKRAYKEYETLSKGAKSEYASEALYYIAYITYKQDNLIAAEKKIFEILTNISHDYWLAKSYILLGDIYLDKGNSFQAKHTYLSIIENYDGEDLKAIAQEKYNAIVEKEENKEKENKELKQQEEDNTEIN